jgi:hypothetical protein
MLAELAGKMPALLGVAYASQRASALGILAQVEAEWEQGCLRYGEGER